MTCLWSQIFIDAESLVAGKMKLLGELLAGRKAQSRLSSFIRSTIECRQSSFSLLLAASLSRIEVTSTGVPGLAVEAGAADDEGADAAGFAGEPGAAAVPEAGAALACPKMSC